jgi:hypothetical protein
LAPNAEKTGFVPTYRQKPISRAIFSSPFLYGKRTGRTPFAIRLKKKEYPAEKFLGMMGAAGIRLAG